MKADISVKRLRSVKAAHKYFKEMNWGGTHHRIIQ